MTTYRVLARITGADGTTREDVGGPLPLEFAKACAERSNTTGSVTIRCTIISEADYDARLAALAAGNETEEH